MPFELNPGFVAVTAFLVFTGTGYSAQVLKLRSRSRAFQLGQLPRERVCEGLHPVRELWSFTAFVLFALSGLTRSYIDWFLVGSRLPVVVLATTVLFYLARFDVGAAKRYFRAALLGNVVFIALSVAMLFGLQVHASIIPKIVDYSLAAVSAFLFYGKTLQAFTMVRQRRSAAVSWWRELGLVCKDVTGLWYVSTVGGELFWVGVTHVLSSLSSTAICVAKAWVENIRTSDAVVHHPRAD